MKKPQTAALLQPGCLFDAITGGRCRLRTPEYLLSHLDVDRVIKRDDVCPADVFDDSANILQLLSQPQAISKSLLWFLRPLTNFF